MSELFQKLSRYSSSLKSTRKQLFVLKVAGVVTVIGLIVTGYYIYRKANESKDKSTSAPSGDESTSAPSDPPLTVIPDETVEPGDSPVTPVVPKDEPNLVPLYIIIGVLAGLVVLLAVLFFITKRREKKLTAVLLESGIASIEDVWTKDQKELIKQAERILKAKKEVQKAFNKDADSDIPIEDVDLVAQQFKEERDALKARLANAQEELDRAKSRALDPSLIAGLKSEVSTLKAELKSEKAKDKVVTKYLSESELLPEYTKMKRSYQYLVDLAIEKKMPDEDVKDFAVRDFDEKLDALIKQQLELDRQREPKEIQLNSLRARERTATGDDLKQIKAQIKVLKKEVYNLQVQSSKFADRFSIFKTAKENSRVYIEQQIEEKRLFLEKNGPRFRKASDELKTELREGTPEYSKAKTSLGQEFLRAVLAEDSTRTKPDGSKVPYSETEQLNNVLWKQISIGSLGTREKYALFEKVGGKSLANSEAIEFQLRLSDAVQASVKDEGLADGENPEFNFKTKSPSMYSEKDEADKAAAEQEDKERKKRPRLPFGNPLGGGLSFLEQIKMKRKDAEEEVEEDVKKAERKVGKLATKAKSGAVEESRKAKKRGKKVASSIATQAGFLEKAFSKKEKGLQREVKDLARIQRDFQARQEAAKEESKQFSGSKNPLQAQLQARLKQKNLGER